MFKYLTFKIFFILLFLSIMCCKESEEIHDVEAMIFTYNVDYKEEKAGSIPTNILPDRMELVLAEPYAMNKIEGFFGQFSLIYIADLKKEKVSTLLKIFDKKYVYEGQSGEMPCGISDLNGSRLIKGQEKRSIIGFESQEYYLIRPGKDTLSIYSTGEIKVKNPNITTPYRQHKNFLLKFYTRLSVMDMMLTAEHMEQKKLSNEVFFIPDDYEQISKGNLEKLIHELFK